MPGNLEESLSLPLFNHKFSHILPILAWTGIKFSYLLLVLLHSYRKFFFVSIPYLWPSLMEMHMKLCQSYFFQLNAELWKISCRDIIKNSKLWSEKSLNLVYNNIRLVGKFWFCQIQYFFRIYFGIYSN